MRINNIKIEYIALGNIVATIMAWLMLDWRGALVITILASGARINLKD